MKKKKSAVFHTINFIYFTTEISFFLITFNNKKTCQETSAAFFVAFLINLKKGLHWV